MGVMEKATFYVMGSMSRKINEKNKIAMRLKYALNPEVMRQRSKDWYDKNPGSRYQILKEWRKRNPEKYRAFAKKKDSLKSLATPRWLNKDQKAMVDFLYAKARFLSKHTGISHVVDHVIPLQSELVRGLHVPWNLQILTRVDNSRKSNKVG